MNERQITVIGAGYVGLSNAILLATKYDVYLVDNNIEKLKNIKNKISPIKDDLITEYLQTKNLNLYTDEFKESYKTSDIFILALPTNYIEEKNEFDTSILENVIEEILNENRNCKIIIKSTIPSGFTRKMIQKYDYQNIIFMPEFLREGQALQDNLYPSRIIIGSAHKLVKNVNDIYFLYQKCILKENVPVLFTGLEEAETIKLFANNYLAMRVCFFNELDSYAMKNGLNSKELIQGVSLDDRIGTFYNNPSFGYGGYCFPKDVKQLISQFKKEKIHSSLINSIDNSNKLRMLTIINDIDSICKEKNYKNIGVYKLAMKSSSDNARCSAILAIINGLKNLGYNILVYDPIITNEYENISTIEELNNRSDLILANRIDLQISKFKNKIYTRDIFNNN